MSAMRVVRVRDRDLILGALRLGLGLAAVALSVTRVSGDRIVFGAAVGALAFGVVGGARQIQPRGRAGIEPLPGDAAVVSAFRSAIGALFPSSIGVFALALVGVAVRPVLAPVLAGLLFGMALATAAWVARLTARERAEGKELFAALDDEKRSFSRPRPA